MFKALTKRQMYDELILWNGVVKEALTKRQMYDKLILCNDVVKAFLYG